MNLAGLWKREVMRHGPLVSHHHAVKLVTPEAGREQLAELD